MSALSRTPMPMTEADYLAFERVSEVKHEFLAGEVFAMTGASRAHNLICVNLIALLKNQLRGRSCEIYPSDMRIKVQATGLYTYPDISVVCGQAEFGDEHLDTLFNPTVIIEVLSASTERYDRGKKFQHYRELVSLQEYVLIAQDNPHLERFVRQADGLWQYRDVQGQDAVLELTSIKCVLNLAEVYEQVRFSTETDESQSE